MKKILMFLFLVTLMFSCTPTAEMQIKNHTEAMELSAKGKLIMYEGVIYKDGLAYGKYTVTEPEIQHVIVTYKQMDGSDVANLILDGVAPEKAPLKLIDGKEITLNKREYEIEVTEKDGAIYLIENLILKKSEQKKVEKTEKKESSGPKEVSLNDYNKNVDEQMKDNKTETAEFKTETKVEVKETKGTGDYFDLFYKFNKGDVLKYKSVENTTIKMSMGKIEGMDGMPDMAGMGNVMGGGDISQTFLSESDFSINITSVNEDKSANFEMNISSFKVYLMPNKTLIASDSNINTKDLKVKGKITNKGDVIFEEDVYILKTKDDKSVLVYAKLQKDGASAKVQAGDEEVSVYANFDPKTGKASAGVMTNKKEKKAKTETVKVTQEDTRVDILPKEFMQLFRLPDEKLQANKKISVKMPLFKMNLTIDKYENNIANGKMEYSADSDYLKQQGFGEIEISMMPEMNGNVDISFDNEKGVLKSIKGKSKSSMNAGMKIDIETEVEINNVK